MRKVKVAAVQMRCTRDVNANIANAEGLVRKAAADGAQIILLPELFERQYFCQERQYEYYEFAKPVEENDAVKHFAKVAEELKVVLPISFYEKDGKRLFNTVAILDADGTNLGIYRKTHIPDDHYYQEKFYFTPGDTGFKAFKTRYGTIGVGICWDQWFPETARFMAVKGAELLFYPTAIGSEPILSVDSMPHWRRCMQGHSASNLMPVIAYASLGRGFFSGRMKSEYADHASDYLDSFAMTGYACSDNFERLRRCEIIAERHGVTVAQIAMNWIFSHPLNVFAIASMSKADRKKANLESLLLQLSDEEIAYLDLETPE